MHAYSTRDLLRGLNSPFYCLWDFEWKIVLCLASAWSFFVFVCCLFFSFFNPSLLSIQFFIYFILYPSTLALLLSPYSISLFLSASILHSRSSLSLIPHIQDGIPSIEVCPDSRQGSRTSNGHASVSQSKKSKNKERGKESMRGIGTCV